MNFSAGEPEEIQLNLTSFIDIVFNLLIFLVLATTFRDRQTGIQYDLPKAETGSEVKASIDRELVVDREGRIFHGGATYTLDQLDALAERLAAQPAMKEGVMVIRADLAAQHGAVVRVMDTLRRHGLEQIAIGVKEEAAR